jgi:hypothetical protein
MTQKELDRLLSLVVRNACRSKWRTKIFADFLAVLVKAWPTQEQVNKFGPILDNISEQEFVRQAFKRADKTFPG